MHKNSQRVELLSNILLSAISYSLYSSRACNERISCAHLRDILPSQPTQQLTKMLKRWRVIAISGQIWLFRNLNFRPRTLSTCVTTRLSTWLFRYLIITT